MIFLQGSIAVDCIGGLNTVLRKSVGVRGESMLSAWSLQVEVYPSKVDLYSLEMGLYAPEVGPFPVGGRALPRGIGPYPPEVGFYTLGVEFLSPRERPLALEVASLHCPSRQTLPF